LADTRLVSAYGVRVRKLEVKPFTDADIPVAGRMLAERHRRHREALSLLSPRFEDSGVAQQEVEAAWAVEGASGALALTDGEPIGYLLGAPKSETWGPNMWVESAGQAVRDAEIMRDLYAFAARRWYDEGRTAHYVLVPAQDAGLVDAWFRTGFGQQQTHGIQPVRVQSALPPGRVLIRRAVRSDIPMLARLDVALPDHQGQSPVFSSGPKQSLAEAMTEWEEDFDNPDFVNFVAEVDGHVIGSAIGCALEKSGSHTGLARPDNAGFLGFAAVLPEARGLGAGRALGEAVIHWSKDSGFDCVVTDWRTTNLLSSRTWTNLGFMPSFLRLHRLIRY
jgi:GNAT superfamily N-acetyltransferase